MYDMAGCAISSLLFVVLTSKHRWLVILLGLATGSTLPLAKIVPQRQLTVPYLM